MSGPGLDTPYWSQDAAALSAALGSGRRRPFVGKRRHEASPGRAQQRRRRVAAERAPSACAAIREPARPHPHLRRRDLAGAAAVGGFGHHSGDRARKHAARLLSGVPGIGGGRGAETPTGADLPCLAGRCRADGAREHDRARRPHPAVGWQSDPCRWPGDRGGGLPGQRSEHDGRIFSRREAARDRAAGGGAFGSDQCGLSRRLGPKRHGKGPRRRNRSPDRVRGDRSTA